MSAVDVIVIGAGANGLTAAAVLAAKGRRVRVLERAERLGGMARNTELAEGVHGPEMAHLLYNLSPKVAKELSLKSALKLHALADVALAEDGAHAVFDGDSVRLAGGAAHPEAEAFLALHRRLCRFAGLLGQLADRTPPEIAGGIAGLSDLGALGRLGLDLKRMGKAEMREFLRILLSNVYDLLLEDLGDGPLAGMLAADAVRGAHMGPRSPGTVFSLMYRLGQGGRAHLPEGGMGAVTEALAEAARRKGADIRTGCAVAAVLTEGDTVRGVRLEDGSEIAASCVVSSLAAPVSMHLAGVANYDIEAARRLRHMRARGNVAKVNLVLGALPEVPGLSRAEMAGRLVVAGSVTAVERAFNPVKYGEMSEAPVIEAVIPTLTDRSLARDGRHVLSANVQFVPYDPAGGWTEHLRETLRARVTARLDAVLPGLSGRVEAAEILTPADIEARIGAPGGHWHHGELSLDQLLTVRPVNGLARYRFGPRGYYLCGASAHPGGDVSGAAGRNAARQVLKDGGAA